ncbi:MAG: acyl-CoA-binding protein [Deltaproteobacteria bacterium]|nr:acyl-CoA-binding protein [Deltaproteobacteria bacterium]
MAIEDQFKQALEKLKTLPAQPNDVMLDLYSLYKQSTVGDVSGKKPGMFDIVAKAKYEAWEKRKGLTKDQAMQAYAALVDELAKKV